MTVREKYFMLAGNLRDKEYRYKQLEEEAKRSGGMNGVTTAEVRDAFIIFRQAVNDYYEFIEATMNCIDPSDEYQGNPKYN